MNPHVRHALFAAAFTALLFVVFGIQVRVPTRSIFTLIVPSLLFPGFLAAALFGLKGGTDGAPSFMYAFPFSFLIYWLLFELGHIVWRLLSRKSISNRN